MVIGGPPASKANELPASKANELMVRYDNGRIVTFSQCKADGLSSHNPSHRPNPLYTVLQYCNAHVIK